MAIYPSTHPKILRDIPSGFWEHDIGIEALVMIGLKEKPAALQSWVQTMPEIIPYCHFPVARAEAIELYNLQMRMSPIRLLPCDLPLFSTSHIGGSYRIFDVEDGHVTIMGLDEGEWADPRPRGEVFPFLEDPDFCFHK